MCDVESLISILEALGLVARLHMLLHFLNHSSNVGLDYIWISLCTVFSVNIWKKQYSLYNILLEDLSIKIWNKHRWFCLFKCLFILLFILASVTTHMLLTTTELQENCFDRKTQLFLEWRIIWYKILPMLPTFDCNYRNKFYTMSSWVTKTHNVLNSQEAKLQCWILHWISNLKFSATSH